MLPAFLTTILFAVSAVSAGRTSKLLGGVQANFWRISLATILLALWAHFLGQGLTGDAFPVFLFSGALGFGIGDLALYQSLPRLGSRLSIMLVHCLASPFAALMEYLWLGTTLHLNEVLASVVILTGVALALAPGDGQKIKRQTLVVGVLFGVLAAFGQGGGAVVSRKAYAIARAAGQHTDGLTAAYQRILAGWVVAAAFFAFTRWRAGRSAEAPAASEFHIQKAKPTWQIALPWIVLNAIAGPSLGVGCYQWALSSTPTGVVLPIVAITPLVVIPLARLVEGEKPTRRSLLGGVIAVAGAVTLAATR